MIPLQQVMPAALASVLRQAPLSPEKVAFAWRTAVGAAVDRASVVELRGCDARRVGQERRMAARDRAVVALIRARLDLVLGPGVVTRIDVAVVERTDEPARRSDRARDRRHPVGRAAAHRQVPRRAEGLHRASSWGRSRSARPSAAPASIPASVDECVMGNVVSAGLGQAPARQAALGAGLSDAVAGRHRQQGVRIGSEGGDAGRAGHSLRRRARGRGRRHGVDEPGAVPAGPRARRVADGARPGPRFDGARRPVVRARSSGTWARPARWWRSSITSRARPRIASHSPATGRRRRRRAKDASPRRSCRSRCRARASRRSSSTPTSRCGPTRRSKRWRRLRPAFRDDGTVTAGNAPPVNDGAAALVLAAASHATALGVRGARAHRGPGRQRPGPEVRADDPGRIGAPRAREGRLERWATSTCSRSTRPSRRSSSPSSISSASTRHAST